MRPCERLLLVFVLAGATLSGCASSRGSVQGNVSVQHNGAQPQPAYEPDRPEGFPEVTLIWKRASGERPARPRAAARTSRQVLPAETAAVLPDLDGDATAAQRAFHQRAVRAVRLVVDLDKGQPAELLKVNEQLDGNPALKPLLSSWQPVIEKTIERAFLLRHFADPLRKLRRAFGPSRFDGSTGLYSGVDTRACAEAFAKLEDGGDSVMNLEVTVKPVGRRSIVYFQALCENAPN